MFYFFPGDFLGLGPYSRTFWGILFDFFYLPGSPVNRCR